MGEPVVIGLNTGHDGGAAIMVGGRIVVAISEERLTRNKYTKGYINSVVYCLKAANLSIDDVNLFVFSSCGRRLKKEYVGDLGLLGVNPRNCLNVDHHLSHAFAAFCMSGFDKSLILVIDGQGNDNDTESYFVGNGDVIKKIGGNESRRKVSKGIGRTYESVTNYLGWVDQNAGLTMGLSAYGNGRNYKLPLFSLKDMTVYGPFNHKYEKGVIDFVKKNKLDFGKIYSLGKFRKGQDLAALLQSETERIVVELVEKLVMQTGIKKLCLSGGVALNCGTNYALYKSGVVDDLFVLPASSDRGQCLGNALYGYFKLTGKLYTKKMKNDYFGVSYTDNEIVDALDKGNGAHIKKAIPNFKLKYKKVSDIAKVAAKKIYENNIVGWFQGGSELGPRALGNRSIICNPTSKKMKDVLNKRVKHREEFRPFAPSCLEEYATEYFDLDKPSPYMLFTAKVKKDKRKKIPAVVHVDGTSRVQTVNKNSNELYYNLISNFLKLSGVPMVLNTSFNNREPIVETPGDAVSTFLSTDLDYLAIGDYLAWKEVI